MKKHLVCLLAALPLLAMPVAAAEERAGELVRPTGDARVPESDVSAYMRGGSPVSVKDHPYMIAMLRPDGSRPKGQTCSAAVVAPRKVVTAAHCAGAGDGTDKTLLYGLDDLNEGEGTPLKIVDFTLHPSYNGQKYDVAVVTTDKDIPVPDGAFAKVATSQDSDITAPGALGEGLGYGKKDPDDTERNVELHRGEFPTEDAGKCSDTGLPVDHATMLCAGYPDGKVTILPGDSGGPLLVDGKIVGVASWSESKWQWYSIYARLNNEMGDWVNEQIGAGS